MVRIRKLLLCMVLLAPAAAWAQGEGGAEPDRGEAPPSGEKVSILYAQAVYEEAITGELGKAIKLYRRVIESGAETSLRARATFRTGACYEKLGQTGLARKAYRKAVEEFASEQAVAKLAKLALLRIGPSEQDSDKWVSELRSEVSQLATTLEATAPQIEKLKAELSGNQSKTSEEIARIFNKMIEREEVRNKVRRYLASHYFRTALRSYQALDYKRAAEGFRAACNLDPDNELLRGYLDKTEFILGRRAKLSHTAMYSAPDNPSAKLLEELKAAYELARNGAKEGDYRMALAGVEEILERVCWTDDELVTDEVKALLKKADALAEECFVRLYPAESRNLIVLSEERKELARKLKKKLSDALCAQEQALEMLQGTLRKARELREAGLLPQAKELLESYLAGGKDSPEVREMLEEIDRAVLRRQDKEDTSAVFKVIAVAISLPREEIGKFKIDFASVKPADGESSPFVRAVVSEEKGKQIISAAALAGRNALSRFTDMKVASGKKGSGFLGSSMTYVSGFRKVPGGDGETYEPVTDIVFQGIKLSVLPRAKGGKAELAVEATVSVVAGEPRIVQTERGNLEIPMVYKVTLNHTFTLNVGEYLVVGSFPNTLAPGGAKDKPDMYLLLSPRKEAQPETGPDKDK